MSNFHLKPFVGLLFVMQTLLICSTPAQEFFLIKNGSYKYYEGVADPDSSWNKNTFDDSSWKKGKASIGFGDGDDSTIISNVPSVYIRSVFDVVDKSSYKELVLSVDFDDAFIAYLNGVEVVRVNLGKKGDTTHYNTLAEKSHESYLSRSYRWSVPSYILDSSVIANILTNGNNWLCIEVHNDSINGSDMSFTADLVNNTWFDYYDGYSRAIEQTPLDSSKFPIVKINTDEYEMPNTHEKYVAQMGIINNSGKYNKPTDSFNNFSGRITIERRGESSSGFPKMSFNIETEDADGNNLDTALLGMPSDNDWVLFSAYTDKSFIRSELTFNLGRHLGHYVPRTRYCELILNGEYVGLYIMMEKIKRGKNRVPVAKADSLDGPEDIGYIVKYDKPNNAIIQYVYPKKDEITDPQKAYLQKFFKAYENIFKSPYFFDSQLGYKKFIDENSLVDYIVINELAKNADSYLFSTFLYKDKESKDPRLKFGPLWDYDLAYGNTFFQEGYKTDGWQFAINGVLRIVQIMRDTNFVKSYESRWFSLRKTWLSDDSIMNTIDELTSNIYESRIRNYNVWHTLDKDLFYPVYQTRSYDEDIAQIKDWIVRRTTWIDANIGSIYYPMPNGINSREKIFINVYAYPNPFVDNLKVNILSEMNGICKVQLTDVTGKVILARNVQVSGHIEESVYLCSSDFSDMKQGIYMLSVTQNTEIIYRCKLMKSK